MLLRIRGTRINDVGCASRIRRIRSRIAAWDLIRCSGDSGFLERLSGHCRARYHGPSDSKSVVKCAWCSRDALRGLARCAHQHAEIVLNRSVVLLRFELPFVQVYLREIIRCSDLRAGAKTISRRAELILQTFGAALDLRLHRGEHVVDGVLVEACSAREEIENRVRRTVAIGFA